MYSRRAVPRSAYKKQRSQSLGSPCQPRCIEFRGNIHHLQRPEAGLAGVLVSLRIGTHGEDVREGADEGSRARIRGPEDGETEW